MYIYNGHQFRVKSLGVIDELNSLELTEYGSNCYYMAWCSFDRFISMYWIGEKAEIHEYLSNERGIIMRILRSRSMTRIPNFITAEQEAFVSHNLLYFRLSG